MISLRQVEEQLKKVGCNYRFWGRAEIRELSNILVPGETIAHCVNGRYEGGFAMLCVTDHRLLLIDRKPMFLSLEDIRFDMIAEIDYSNRVFDGLVTIVTPNRKLIFYSWSQAHLREVLNYTQQQILNIRRQFMTQQFRDQAEEARSAVGSLALQTPAGQMPQTSWPLNPYAQNSFTMKRRRLPKFY